MSGLRSALGTATQQVESRTSTIVSKTEGLGLGLMV